MQKKEIEKQGREIARLQKYEKYVTKQLKKKFRNCAV